MAVKNLLKTELVDYTAWLNKKIQKETKRVLNDNGLLEEQKAVLREYYKAMLSNKKDSSIVTILRLIRNFGVHTKKAYNEVTKQDIIDYVEYKKLKKNRKSSYLNQSLIYIKCFYKWLYQTEDYPEIVKWIKPKLTDKEIREEDLITKEDTLRLLKATSSVRDKALIMVLRDSGARIGEILSAKKRNVIIDSYGAKISVDGKTGQRNIRLIDSVPFLQDWLNEHPFTENPNSPLFICLRKNYGQPLTYHGVRTFLKTISRKSGLNKPLNAHNFRHSKVNEVAKDGFNERELRIMFGWKNDSKMPDKYTHYGEEAVDKKILEKAGKLDLEDTKKKEEEKKILQPKLCARCKTQNPPTAIYCNCGMALDLKNVVKDIERREQADNEMNELFADAEFRELVKGYLRKKQQE